MKLAVLSDVHADVHALRDALAQIERMGCEQIVCAGDLVDYGLFPEETIALLRERAIPCIRGNHDRWAVGRGASHEPSASVGGRGHAVHDATGFDLSREALAFLTGLPTAWDAVIEGTRVALRHGTPASDMHGINPDALSPDDMHRWLAAVRADVLLVGHTHVAFAANLVGGGMIANPGALLREPADGEGPPAMLFDPATGTFTPAPAAARGTFGVLELPARRFTVHRASDGGEVPIARETVGIVDRRRR